MDNLKHFQLTVKDVIFRKATVDDYDGIMAISEGLYNGLDILPSMYIEYLSDPLRVSYVAAHKQKVISFGVNHVVDDGLTVVGESARTHPEYNGLGVFNAMRVYMMKHSVLPNFPGVSRILYQTDMMDDLKRNKEMMILPGSIRIQTFLASDVTKSQFQEIMKTRQIINNELKIAQKQDITDLFENSSFTSRYIPSGIILRAIRVFTLKHLSNVDLIMKEGFGDFYISKDPTGELKCLSIGTGHEASVSLATYKYIIDYYGPQDLKLMQLHINKHLQQIAAFMCEDRFRAIQKITIIFVVLDTMSVQLLEKLYLTSKQHTKSFRKECVFQSKLSPRQLTEMSKV